MQIETKTLQRKLFIPSSISVPLFPAATRSCALLNQFKPQEKPGDENRQSRIRNQALYDLARLFRDVEWFDNATRISGLAKKEHFYGDYRGWIGRIVPDKHNKNVQPAPRLYTASEIELFSAVMAPLHRPGFHHISVFLAALINTSSDQEFTIFTRSLDSGPLAVGYRNTKIVTVYGDAGDRAGRRMESGRLEIHGNAGDYPAHRMSGGEMFIHGNCGPALGIDMTGGAVHVDGNIPFIAVGIEGGNVFQRGRQLVRDGVKIAEPRNK